MLAAQTTFTATVTGRYGAFAGLGAQENLANALNANGIVLTAFVDNEPSLLSQVLDGDVFDRPYQLKLAGVLVTNAFQDAAMIASVLAACVSQALDSTPTDTSVDTVNGWATGQIARSAPVYGVDALASGFGNAAKKALAPIIDPAILILVIAVVGLVLIAQSGSVKVRV